MFQKFELTEEQILLIIEYLITLGILVLKEGTYNDEEDIQCLQLPHFPALSTKRCYYITWMENFPDIEPRLNWTSALFDGDLEIGIRYVFPFGIPDGFDDRLMCVCCQMCYRGRYKHHWKHGLLAKIDQVLIHLSSQRQQDSDEHIIVFTGRITVDEEEGERKATKVLWTQLAIVLHETEIYISQWPGLLRKVFIQPGPWYFEGEAPTQPVHIPLIDCFHFLDKGEDSLEISIDEQLFHVDLHELLPRTDDNKLNIVEWFDWLSSLESEYTQDSNTPIETFDVVGAGPLVVTTKMEQPTKNKGTVKWDLQGDNTNGQLKELSNVEFQTAVAKFVANIITQSFSKLALEMEQTKQGSTRIEEKSVSVLEKTLNRKSHSRRLSKSSTKSKTCEIL
ncbi:uncharacterized protein [Antedon mediterranea]|uniref:uncharacterized protein n=1 Tax=Antedon mediterranea TaxID=105859 RepID=UPI003AF60BD4